MICKEELLEHIKKAIELEEEGINGYCELASMANNDKVSLFFEGLADDERLHKELFESLLHHVEMDSEINLEPQCSKHEKIDSSLFETYKSPEEITKNIKAAMVYALESEQKSFEFYMELAHMEVSTKIRDIFLKIAEFEKEHYNILKERLDKLS